ncbi:MAG: hypothetical protein ACT4PL_14610 [Phycisphaerales bacterium]
MAGHGLTAFVPLDSGPPAARTREHDRPSNDRLPHLLPPGIWGAAGTTPTVPGGIRWTVPAGRENRLVGNISWRMAAM